MDAQAYAACSPPSPGARQRPVPGPGREGSLVIGSTSRDGVTEVLRTRITTTGSILVGLTVSAHNDGAACRAVSVDLRIQPLSAD